MEEKKKETVKKKKIKTIFFSKMQISHKNENMPRQSNL